jgi:hypothetical protein
MQVSRSVATAAKYEFGDSEYRQLNIRTEHSHWILNSGQAEV